VIKTLSYDDDDLDPDWHLTRIFGAGVVVLILCLGGLYLYRRATLEEEQAIEYTRPITTDDSFEFSALDSSDPRSSPD
jgi:hypothetical protein